MPDRGYRLLQRLALSFTLAISQGAIARSDAQDVTIYALGLVGVTYKFGGNSPDSGLDCSGFVRHVFQEVTGASLPRTAKEMSGVGARIGARELVPGDLVFFNTRRFAFSHVGIYLGEDRFVHAPSRGGEVEIARLSLPHWQKRYDGARRLIAVPVTTAAIPFARDPATASPFARDPADATP